MFPAAKIWLKEETSNFLDSVTTVSQKTKNNKNIVKLVEN